MTKALEPLVRRMANPCALFVKKGQGLYLFLAGQNMFTLPPALFKKNLRHRKHNEPVTDDPWTMHSGERMNAMKKWVIASTAVLVILAGSGMYLLNRKPDLDAMMPQNSWAQAQSGTVEVTISGSGSISPSKRDSLEADTNSKVDEVLVSENQSVKEGEELITFTNGEEVIAPYDGIITKVQVKEDDRVQDQTAVLEIISSQELEAVVEVDELDISKVKTGQSASIKVNAFPEKTFTGKVTEIKPEGDVSNGVSSFEVSVKIDQPSNLKSGMTTQVTITAEKKENALVIPVEAIHSGSDGKYVWVPNRNQTKNAPAEIGRAHV